MTPAAPSASFAQLKWERWLLIFAGLVLWIVALDFPDAASDWLDASWQSVLVDAHQHGRQFGKEIIFTWGPWGWLGSHFYLPGSLGPKIVFELISKALFAAVVVAASARLPVVRRWLLLAATVLLAQLFPDALLNLALALATLMWVMERETPRWLLWSTLGTMAFFAHVKFTNTVACGAGIALAGAAHAWRGHWRRGAESLVVFGGVFLVLWVAAGQNPVRLIDYLRYCGEISRGYAPAMALSEEGPIWIVGLLVAVLNGVLFISVLRRPEDRARNWPLALFVAAIWFLAWKQGFTRADGHVLGFFLACLLIGIALPTLLAGSRRWHWYDISLPLCLVGMGMTDANLLKLSPAIARDHLVRNPQELASLSTFPARFEAAVQREHAAHPLTAVKAAVGSASVDLINYEQGLLLLEGLNYQPRPIFQSYVAYTPALMAKNLRFFQSPRAPDFVVTKIQSIDARYPTLDDALVLAELPRRYSIASETDDYVLLKKKSVGELAPDLRREKVLLVEAALDQPVALPTAHTQALWIDLAVHPTLLGKLRSAAYRPPILYMIATEESGRETRHRLVLPVTAEGFLIQPFLETARDYAAFVRGEGQKWLKQVRFVAETPDENEFWKGVTVRVSALPDLPLHPADPLVRVLSSGIANRQPRSVHSDVNKLFFTLGDHEAFLVHARGELEFDAGDDRTVTGSFGLAEGAYTNGNKTDGAEFVLEAIASDGTKSEAWRKRLDPIANPADRGEQSFTARLPKDTVRVILRTLPGPNNNTDWDWTYWSQLRFAP